MAYNGNSDGENNLQQLEQLVPLLASRTLPVVPTKLVIESKPCWLPSNGLRRLWTLQDWRAGIRHVGLLATIHETRLPILHIGGERLAPTLCAPAPQVL